MSKTKGKHTNYNNESKAKDLLLKSYLTKKEIESIKNSFSPRADINKLLLEKRVFNVGGGMIITGNKLVAVWFDSQKRKPAFTINFYKLANLFIESLELEKR